MNRNDADIITRARADMTDFVRPIENALTVSERGFQRFGKTVDASMVEVSTSTSKAAKDVQRELAGIATAQTTVARNIGQNRAAFQQLGFQLSDVAAQAANGTSALTIFAQQGGQAAFALSQFGGTLGRVGTFLAGPWGAGLTAAALAVGALTAAANESGGAGEALADKYGAAGLRIRDTFIEPIGEAARSVRALVAEELSNLADNTVRELDFAAQKVDEFADFVQRTNGLIPRLLNGGPALLESRLEAVRQAQARELAGRRADQRLAGSAANRAFGFDRTTGEFELAGGSPARTRAAIKSAQDAQAEAQRQLRAAEQAREDALQKELELVERQGAKVRDLAEITARLEGGFSDRFDSGIARLRDRFNPGTSVFDAGGPEELKQIVDKELKRAGLGVAENFEERGLVAVQAIAQAFGGGVGSQIARIVGVLRGLQTGDFTSVGGRAGGILTLLNQTGQGQNLLQSILGPQAASGISSFAQAAGPYAAAYLAGQEINKALGQDNFLGKIGGVAGGTLGRIIGLNDARKSSVSLTGAGGGISVGGPVGNSRTTQRNAAIGLGGTLEEQFRSIVSELGGSTGSFAVSIGARDGKFAVDPTGRGNTGTKYGARQFDTEAEAIAFALQDILRDGGLQGVSQTIQNALRNASSLDRGLQDALTIKGISDRVKALDDPLGATLANVNREFDRLRETLVAAGASSSELADLERLRAVETKAVTEQSVATLRAFQSSLQIGGNSPLSLTDQRRNAELAFSKFETDIRAGRAIDQSAFVSAGQNLLDVERQISGGTAGFFDTFNRVQGATTAAIGGVQNATAIREAELAAAAKSTADSSAALVNIGLEQNQLLANLSQQLAQAGFGGFVGAEAAARGFVRAA